jgi:hypothetical protein
VKPIPIIVLATYILLFAIVGLIFGWMAVAYALISMFALGTVVYVLVLLEEEPWKYANTTENLFGYALMAYCVVFLFIPIIILNILSDMRDEGKISVYNNDPCIFLCHLQIARVIKSKTGSDTLNI